MMDDDEDNLQDDELIVLLYEILYEIGSSSRRGNNRVEVVSD